jgi:hypothetical protein
MNYKNLLLSTFILIFAYEISISNNERQFRLTKQKSYLYMRKINQIEIISNVVYIDSIEYWNQNPPLKFFTEIINNSGTIFFVKQKPKSDWYNVSKNDIEKLKKYISMKTVSGAVYDISLDMYLPCDSSTVSIQAIFLLKGIYEHNYPPCPQPSDCIE